MEASITLPCQSLHGHCNLGHQPPLQGFQKSLDDLTLLTRWDADSSRTLFFRQQVMPFLISHRDAAVKENLQTPAQRAQVDEATKCILCAACYSACPVVQTVNPKFLGPAAGSDFPVFQRAGRGAAEILSDYIY